MAGQDQQDQPSAAIAGEKIESSVSSASPSKALEHHRPISDVSTPCKESLGVAVNASKNLPAPKFLRLPLEVRLMIYKALIGEKLVHVRLDMAENCPSCWRHVICHGDGAKVSEDQQDPRVSDDWEPAHHFCRQKTYPQFWNQNDPQRLHDRMHLSILRCCKQLYAESNPILWSTNTFSIHDHHTLRRFLIERNPTQKSYMKTLRLRFDLTQRLLHYRRHILTPEMMLSFSKLETLHLILEDDLSPRLAHMMAMTGKSLVEFGGNRIDPGLETLTLLPLKKVSVEVLTPEIPDSEQNRFTESWRKEYAERVQKFLLNRST